MPETIEATQPKGMEWIIDGIGHAKYAFVLVKLNRIVPNSSLATIGIPDATPEMIRKYALDDESYGSRSQFETEVRWANPTRTVGFSPLQNRSLSTSAATMRTSCMRLTSSGLFLRVQTAFMAYSRA